MAALAVSVRGKFSWMNAKQYSSSTTPALSQKNGGGEGVFAPS
jgi:hypothetical protein